MRKSTIFISAILTTFVLVLLVGLVSAYKNTSSMAETTTQQDPIAVVADSSVPTTNPTTIASITPEQAAALAAQVLGRTDVYSVETSAFNGADAYLVTFSSGDLVYVSPQGLILSVVNAPVVVYSAPAPAKNKNHKPSGGGGGGGGGGEHEPEGED